MTGTAGTGIGSTALPATSADSFQYRTGRRSGNLDVALLVWTFAVDPGWEPTVSANVARPVVPSTNANPDGHLLLDDADSVLCATAICEIRRRSGLGWSELAALFGVSREEVCSWASGGPLGGPGRHLVRSTLKAIRHLDRGTSRDTRTYLLAIDGDAGTSAFQLLREQRFSEAMARKSDGGVSSRRRPALSKEAQDLRRPESVTALLQADQSRPDFATLPRIAHVLRAPPAGGE